MTNTTFLFYFYMMLFLPHFRLRTSFHPNLNPESTELISQWLAHTYSTDTPQAILQLVVRDSALINNPSSSNSSLKSSPIFGMVL